MNALLPGLVDTPLLAKSGDGTREAPWARQARQFLPVMAPEVIADAVLDLVADDDVVGEARIVGELPPFVTELL